MTPEPAQPKAKARGGAKKRGGRGAAAPGERADGLARGGLAGLDAWMSHSSMPVLLLSSRCLPCPPPADAAAEMAAAAAAAAAGGAKAVRAAGRTAEPAEDRAEVVQRRKQQRLQVGFMPAPWSGWSAGGRLAVLSSAVRAAVKQHC